MLTAEAEPAQPVEPSDRSSMVWTTMAVGIVVAFLVRAYFALPRSGPVVLADEVGYLLNARLITGGPGADLTGASVYSPGYSLLLSPLSVLSDGPHATYVLALMMNAALGAGCLPLLYALVRATGAGRLPGALCAFVAAVTPAAIVYSQFAMADAALPFVVCLWAVCVLRCGDPRQGAPRVSEVGVVLASTTLWLLHPLGQILVTAFLVVCLLRLLLRPSGAHLRSCVLAGLSAAGGFTVDRFLGSITAPMYGEVAPGAAAFGRVEPTAEYLTAWAGATAGQLWALSGPVLGLSLLGLLQLFGAGSNRSSRLLGASLIVGILGVVTVTGMTFVGLEGASYSVYERYVAMFQPVLVALGLAFMFRSRPSIPVTLALVLLPPVLLGVTMALDGERLSAGAGRPFVTPVATVISGALPQPDALQVQYDLTRLAVLPLLASIVLVGLWLLPTGLRMVSATVVLGFFLWVGLASAASIPSTLDEAFYPGGYPGSSLDVLSREEPITWMDPQGRGGSSRFIYQWVVDWRVLELGSVEPSSMTGYLIAPEARDAPGRPVLLTTPEGFAVLDIKVFP